MERFLPPPWRRGCYWGKQTPVGGKVTKDEEGGAARHFRLLRHSEVCIGMVFNI